MKNKCVISASGGMDSTALILRMLSLNYEVNVISFDYGQKHALELRKLQKNIEYLSEKNLALKSFKIVDLKSAFSAFDSALLNDKKIPVGHYEDESMKATVVPNRNAIFSSIIFGWALSIAQIEKTPVEICLGVHSGDHTIYPDCTPEFYFELEQAFKTGNWNSELVNFTLPFISSNKSKILIEAIQNCKYLGLDFNTVFRNTLTSYNPDYRGRASGTSGSDIERIEAFLEIGIPDPAEYVESWDFIVKQYHRIISKK